MIQPARLIGSALDSLVGIFSPRMALGRQYARSAMYAAAQSPRTMGSWAPVDAAINDVISNSALSVRARVRQLVRDFPYFARAVAINTDYIVGSGIVFQSAITLPDGKFDKKRIQQAEDAWNMWADEADAGGRLHLYEMQALAKRQELECGEYFLILRTLKDRKRYLPLALQMYEADWLTNMGATSASGNQLHEGVEYDKSTGRALAYHFTDPDGWGKTVRIPAEQVIHGFRTLRPGQLRGISDFAPGIMVAKDLATYMDAEIDAAKMAARWVGTIETPDMLGRQIGMTVEDGKKIDTIENAIIEYLRPGEKMNLMANPRPGSNFPPMVKLILTMLAVTTGVPYEILSGNYEGMNYSVGKMVRNDFAQMLRPQVTRHIRGFCNPVKSAFFDAAVLGGRLPLFRDYYTNPTPSLRCTWQPPGMESIDVARETKSMIDQIKAGLRSPQEIAASRGRDLEEVYKEIKEAQDLAESMGVTVDLGAISTALANNPAALAGQDAKEPKKGAPANE